MARKELPPILKKTKRSSEESQAMERSRRRSDIVRGRKSVVDESYLRPHYPWEQLPKEPRRAFEAFTIYLNLGPKMRSKRTAFDHTQESWKRIVDWSSKWEWSRRAQAWDRHIDRINRYENEKAILEMNKRQAKNASAGIAAAMNTLLKHIPTPKNPKPPIMRVSDAVRLLDVCSKLERVSRGEPDSIQETKGEVTVKESERSGDDRRKTMVDLLHDPEMVEHMAAVSKFMGTDGSNGSG